MALISNPDLNLQGLRVYAMGKLLDPSVPLGRIPLGQYLTTIEVYRGPEAYEYPPLNLALESACDAEVLAAFFSLTVNYVRTCARAEFYSLVFNTFSVDTNRYVL